MTEKVEGPVFGIGLSKTGTTSLSAALRVLGYETVHFPRIPQSVAQAEYDLPIMREVDAITDTPAALLFPHLDVRHPGARFILTVRNKESWLDSAEQYYAVKDAKRAAAGTLDRSRFWRLAMFGCYRFNRERFSYVYDRHIREVRHYFRNRQSDLLEMDLTLPGQWQKLSGFLNRSAPNVPFPHLNERRRCYEEG